MDSIAVEIIKGKFGSTVYNWLEDNCPAQTGDLVNEWSDIVNSLDGTNLRLIRFPPYSPDAYIIKKFWGLVKAKLLNGNFVPRDSNEFRNKIFDVWSSFSADSDFCKPYFQSIDIGIKGSCRYSTAFLPG